MSQIMEIKKKMKNLEISQIKKENQMILNVTQYGLTMTKKDKITEKIGQTKTIQTCLHPEEE